MDECVYLTEWIHICNALRYKHKLVDWRQVSSTSTCTSSLNETLWPRRVPFTQTSNKVLKTSGKPQEVPCWLGIYVYSPLLNPRSGLRKPECAIKQTTSTLWIEGCRELSRIRLLCPSYLGKRSIFQPYLVEPSEQDSLIIAVMTYSAMICGLSNGQPLNRNTVCVFLSSLRDLSMGLKC